MKRIFLIAILALPAAAVAVESWPGGSGTVIADSVGGELGEGYEPSGAVWDEDGGTLFIVGDDGDLDELSADGTVLNSWHPSGNFDLEGVTLNTGDDADNFVYLGVENPDGIKQFNTSTGNVVRSWDLTPWMNGADNQGLEALTFVPNGDHPYTNSSSGGLFYAGLQETGDIYVLDIDTDSNGTYTHIDTIDSPNSSNDLAGLAYFNDVLYGVDDNSDRLWTADTSGTLTATYELFGTTEEGIALDTTCPGDSAVAFIANDVTGGDGDGDVRSYPNFPVTCPAEDETPDPNPDDDSPDEPDNDTDDNTVDDETTSDVISSVSTSGNSITIAMDDGSTATSQPFAGSANVEAVVLRNSRRAVVSNGKRVAVYRGTQCARRKRLRNKRLRHFDLGVRRFSNRAGQTIILAGRRGKKESVNIARLTRGDRVKKVYRARVHKKKNVQQFRIRKKRGARFHVYFGGTKTRWKVGRQGKLKRLR